MYAEGDVEGVLLSLGIDGHQRNDEILALCPMHLERTGREDSNPSWSINVETGVHHCFSCGYKGNLVTLVAEVQEMVSEWGRLDLDAAKKWLKENVSINLDFIRKQLEEARDAFITIPAVVGMSEARLSIFDSTPPDWALSARDLNEDGIAYYGVKWWEEKSSWITPIRTVDGKLLGWQEKSQGPVRYFRNRPAGIKKSTTMFGIDRFSGGTMVVVESPLDCVKLASLGIFGAVATFGASVSDEQLQLMKRADKLILAFDNPRIDPAGAKASKDMFYRLRKAGMEAWFFSYQSDEYKDIGDMPEDLVSLGLRDAKHSVFGEGAFL